ncbi:hypothetical protein [Mycobacterium leprae]
MWREVYAEGEDDDLLEVALREAALALLHLLAAATPPTQRPHRRASPPCRCGAPCWSSGPTMSRRSDLDGADLIVRRCAGP